MADVRKEVCYEGCTPEAYLIKWKVKPGSKINQGTVLLLYDDKIPNGSKESLCNLKKLKATVVGSVTRLLKEEGEKMYFGSPVLYITGCAHPIVMKDMCAECGADLRQTSDDQKRPFASVAMVHSVPELVVSDEQAQMLGKADEQRLLRNRKLVLLVDLDQTLIHTTNDDVPPNLKDVYHFQLHGYRSQWYHARIRPGTKDFLERISSFYELHICTFGARQYAHTVTRFLDEDGRYFSHRILSRDECFSSNSKTANLKALFPCGDKLVCIIDDREDVWNFAPNLVHVKPYHFFQHTGDINAPLGLGKSERDLEEGGKYFYSKKVKSIKRLRKKRKLLNSDVSSCDIEDLDSSGARKGEVQDKTEALKRDECVDQKLIKQTEIRNDNEDKKEMDDSNDCESVTDVDSCCNAHHEYVDSIAEMCKDEEKDTQVKNDNVSPTTGMDRDSFGKKSDEVEQHPIPDEESDSIKTVETDKEVQQREEELLLQSETATPHQTQVIEDEEVKSKLPNAESDTKLNKNENGDDLLVVEDGDDYLMYLSDILITVHKAFYEMYDKMKQDAEGIVLPQEIPDLKRVIPYVRKKVLKGVRIVFSGVIPTNLPLEKSRIFHVAKSLGAEIQTQLVPRKKDNKAIATSHVVAARLGTVKVNEAKRCRGIHIVTPEWLWCCAERWERVNEMLFPLTKETTFENKLHFAEPMKTMVSKPDAEIVIKGIPDVEVNVFPTYDPVTGKRINRPVTSNNVEIKAPSGLEQTSSVEGTDVKASENGSDPEGNFATSLNPLLSFSTEDIAKMDQEVEDILDSLDSDEEESEGEITKKLVLGKKRKRESDADSSSSTSSSSSKSLTGEYPHGWRGVSRGEKITDTDDILDGDCSDSELENSDYPRGILNQKIEGSDNDSERNSEDDFDTSVGSVDEEMAAAVEREFLGL